MSRYFDRTFWGLTIGLIVLLIVNFAFEEWMRGIALQSLSRGLVALGLLILWRTGLISFGHALFFGIGAYAAALLQRAGVGDAFVLLIAGTLASGFLAFLLGFLLRKYRAIYFALLNLAFSMILYGLLVNSAALGSTDGFGVAPPTYLGYDTGGGSRLGFLLYGLTCLLSFGCTNLEIGTPIDMAKTQEIIPGRTDESKIQEWFGKPNQSVSSDTGKIYVYRYLDGNNTCEELIISFTGDTVCTFTKE